MEGGSKCSVNVQGLKKGPWTAAEDAILMEYVRKHGEGNWNSVQKNSGLMRCGKSCRLRWANHLRPNLKKGSFTPDEERIIIDLHSKLGNKWARMASQLPGRTDNEIKNFWNTRMKRRQRAGLPIYPQEFHEDQSTTIHHHHQQHQHQQQKHPNSSSSSSPFSSFLSSRKSAYNPSLPFLDSINFSPTFDHHHFQNSFYSNPNLQFKPFENHHQPQPHHHHHNNANNNNNTLTLPLSPLPHQYTNSPQPCSSLSQFNQNFIDQSIPRTPPLIHYNNIDLENNMSFTSLIMGDHQNANFNIPPHPHELPSNQTPPRPNTPFSSNTNNSGGVCLGGGGDTRNTDQNEVEEECRMLPQIDHEDNRSNSGLLDTLLLESHNLLRKEKLNQRDDEDLSDKGKRKVLEDDDQEEEDEEEGEEVVDEKEGFKRLKLSSTNSTNHSCDDISSSQSSIGMKPNEEPMEEMNSMDDDLLSLLDNFPSTTPLPEWYRTRNVVSEGMSSGTTGDGQEVVVEAQQDHDHETPNVEWGLGSSYWNNMPSIC